MNGKKKKQKEIKSCGNIFKVKWDNNQVWNIQRAKEEEQNQQRGKTVSLSINFGANINYPLFEKHLDDNWQASLSLILKNRSVILDPFGGQSHLVSQATCSSFSPHLWISDVHLIGLKLVVISNCVTPAQKFRSASILMAIVKKKQKTEKLTEQLSLICIVLIVGWRRFCIYTYKWMN